MNTFFGFAVADSMFSGDCIISRRKLSIEEVRELLNSGDIIPCLNPSHGATINAMTARYGIRVEIPEVAPKVTLQSGDSLIVMGVRGLPRLDATRHEYSEEEIASASFAFSMYTVLQ